MFKLKSPKNWLFIFNALIAPEKESLFSKGDRSILEVIEVAPSNLRKGEKGSKFSKSTFSVIKENKKSFLLRWLPEKRMVWLPETALKSDNLISFVFAE